MNLKEKFKEWMAIQKKEDGTEYSSNTINSYCSQLNSAPAKLDNIQDCYKISIFEYSDLQVYHNVENIIFNAPNFDEVNKNAGNQALKYGMLKYEEFLAKLQKDRNQPTDNLTDQLTDLLQHTHNLILHGAPGTGKTFLAKEIAKKWAAHKMKSALFSFIRATTTRILWRACVRKISLAAKSDLRGKTACSRNSAKGRCQCIF